MIQSQMMPDSRAPVVHTRETVSLVTTHSSCSMVSYQYLATLRLLAYCSTASLAIRFDACQDHRHRSGGTAARGWIPGVWWLVLLVSVVSCVSILTSISPHVIQE